jgi:hypothetical protein
MSVSKPKIYNVTCTLADTEYSQALSSFSGKFEIKPRDPSTDIKVSFTSGQSGSLYWTIFGGASDENIGPFAGVKTVYFQSATAGAIVEILEFL